MSGLGLLTVTKLSLPRLEVLGMLLLLELDWLVLLDGPLLVFPLPLLELDELARSLLELAGLALQDVAGLACWGGNICAGGGERLLGGESPT